MPRTTTVHPYFTPASVALRSAGPRRLSLVFFGSRTMAGMLLAAFIAALLVVADQLIETWADGHLLAVWVALWAVAFAAMALSASPLRQLAEAGADEDMLRFAQQDHRVLRDLQVAALRSEYEA